MSGSQRRRGSSTERPAGSAETAASRSRVLANVGYAVSDPTVDNILKRHGIPRASERKETTTWRELIRSHLDVLAASDFFTTEVWTAKGIVTFQVLFFLQVATRRVHVAGVTPCPNDRWMTRVARNVTMADARFLAGSLCLIHDRDGKYRAAFDETITAAGVKPIKLAARSPTRNAYAQRWVRSVKDECLSKLILFGEAARRRALNSRVAPFHAERNHRGNDNGLLFPAREPEDANGSTRCSERLGGLLKP